jgi:integrase
MSVDQRCHGHHERHRHVCDLSGGAGTVPRRLLDATHPGQLPVHPDPVARLVPRTPPRPGGGVDAAALETFIAELKTAGYAPNTIVGRVSAISAFYRWCVRERLADRNPVELIRRPSRPAESSTASLTRHQLTDWLAAAEHRGGAWWAAAMLLALNGLRCGELIACNVEDLGNHSWHHTLKLTTTKGDRPTVVALAPPTMQAVALTIDGRDRGPLLVNRGCPGGSGQ